jgi:TolB protein
MLPSDQRLRDALTREPSPGLAADVFAELALALETTPQVRRRWIGWPVRDVLPGVGPSLARRRLGTFALVVVALLALLAGVAVVGLVGSLRHAPPLGLARPGVIGYDSGGDIFLADSDGTASRAITSSADTEIEPAFALDGSHIAYFSLLAGTTTVRLIVANPDGADARPVAEFAAMAANSGAQVAFIGLAWSPDGRRIAYSAPVAGRAQLFVVGLDGSPPVKIGPPTLEAQDPAWSPDGARIAVRGGHFDKQRGIYVIDSDGRGSPVLISQPPELGMTQDTQFSGPAWSPDGAVIAYSQVVVPGESHVFVGSPAGSDTRDISGGGQYDWTPRWSPDGRWIAWRAGQPVRPGQFVVAKPDGSQRSPLPPTVLGTPIWSPDGRTLIGAAPNVATGSADRLLLIDIAAGTSTEILAEPNGDASWQRLGP